MKKFLLIVLTMALLVTVILVRLHRSEPTPTAVAILPATTIAFVDIPNFQQCRTNFAASPLARFWQNPEMFCQTVCHLA